MDTAAPQLGHRNRLFLSAVCLLSGVLPIVARWLPNEPWALTYGVVVASILGVIALYLGRRPRMSALRPLFIAFFVFALVQVLNNSVPKFVLTHVLNETATAGNPLASTLSGSIVIQLVETAIALIPVFVLTIASGETAGAIYLQRGRIGFWLFATLVFFVGFYLVTFRVTTRHLFAVHGAMTFSRYLSLTLPLLLMVISNGLQEEVLFRALFLKKFISIFGFWTANIIQAAVFTIAHIGISYTANTILFLILFVFPLGFFCGYLMRRTDSVVAPAIFHAGADLPIYLSFLSFVT